MIQWFAKHSLCISCVFTLHLLTDHWEIADQSRKPKNTASEKRLYSECRAIAQLMISECLANAERLQSNCRANELRMPFALKFLGSPKLWEHQISPPWSLAFVCERQRTSGNAERMLNYYWANWYESGAIWQICKRFTFANGYSLKWDRPLKITLCHIQSNVTSNVM